MHVIRSEQTHTRVTTILPGHAYYRVYQFANPRFTPPARAHTSALINCSIRPRFVSRFTIIARPHAQSARACTSLSLSARSHYGQVRMIRFASKPTRSPCKSRDDCRALTMTTICCSPCSGRTDARTCLLDVTNTPTSPVHPPTSMSRE